MRRTAGNCNTPSACVESALDQAKGYVEVLGLPRDVIVTDGIRYRMYAGKRSFAPWLTLTSRA
jgi:hypothetical protein